MSSYISKSNFFFIISLLLSLSSVSFAQRTDIIIMNNGNYINGEIKKLLFGLVSFKTDDMGTLNIKWDKIKHLISKDIFEVQVQDGRIY